VLKPTLRTDWRKSDGAGEGDAAKAAADAGPVSKAMHAATKANNRMNGTNVTRARPIFVSVLLMIGQAGTAPCHPHLSVRSPPAT